MCMCMYMMNKWVTYRYIHNNDIHTYIHGYSVGAITVGVALVGPSNYKAMAILIHIPACSKDAGLYLTSLKLEVALEIR